MFFADIKVNFKEIIENLILVAVFLLLSQHF